MSLAGERLPKLGLARPSIENSHQTLRPKWMDDRPMEFATLKYDGMVTPQPPDSNRAGHRLKLFHRPVLLLD
jgi:hypothetical protein